MKGVLFKSQIGWNISYEDNSNLIPEPNKKTISVSKKDSYTNSFLNSLPGDDFCEVEFEIVEEHIKVAILKKQLYE